VFGFGVTFDLAHFAWRAAPAQALALIDTGIMVAALSAVAAHGFVALRRVQSGP
jgi:hypothetical protein